MNAMPGRSFTELLRLADEDNSGRNLVELLRQIANGGSEGGSGLVGWREHVRAGADALDNLLGENTRAVAMVDGVSSVRELAIAAAESRQNVERLTDELSQSRAECERLQSRLDAAEKRWRAISTASDNHMRSPALPNQGELARALARASWQFPTEDQTRGYVDKNWEAYLCRARLLLDALEFTNTEQPDAARVPTEQRV